VRRRCTIKRMRRQDGFQGEGEGGREEGLGMHGCGRGWWVGGVRARWLFVKEYSEKGGYNFGSLGVR